MEEGAFASFASFVRGSSVRVFDFVFGASEPSESEPEPSASESKPASESDPASDSDSSSSDVSDPPFDFLLFFFFFFFFAASTSFSAFSSSPSSTSFPASSAPSAPLPRCASASSSASRSTPSAAFTSRCFPVSAWRYRRVAPSGAIFGLAHPQFSHFPGTEPRKSRTKSRASAMACAVHRGRRVSLTFDPSGPFEASNCAETFSATRAASSSSTSISPASSSIARSSPRTRTLTPAVDTAAAASRSPARISRSFCANAATRSLASLKRPQCRHEARRRRSTAPKVSGLYTATLRSMCPKCPGQCSAPRRQVAHEPCGSIGPSAGSYSPSVTGLFSASNSTGLEIFFTLIDSASSAS